MRVFPRRRRGSLLGLLLLACGGPPAEAPPPAPAPVASSPLRLPAAQERAYVCADGFPFLVRIEGETAYVTLPERAVALPLMPAESGARYDDGEVRFWSHGETALLSADGELHRDCRPGPPRPR